MPEIVFLNLENADKVFVECVENEKRELRRLVRNLSPADRPSIKYIDAENEVEIHNAIVSATKILHIAGHGHYFGKIQSASKTGSRTLNRLKSFSDFLVSRNEYLDISCVILDSCFSAGFPWRYQLARALGPNREITVLGSSLKIGYKEAEEFFANFYGTLLATKLPARRRSLRTRIESAFNSAQNSYLDDHGDYSRMRTFTLQNVCQISNH